MQMIRVYVLASAAIGQRIPSALTYQKAKGASSSLKIQTAQKKRIQCMQKTSYAQRSQRMPNLRTIPTIKTRFSK